MKTTVSIYDFRRALEIRNRGTQFSHAGLKALFEYLEELEDDMGEELELMDVVIGLCCDFAEYDSLAEFNENYGTTYDEIDDIHEVTTVIKIDDNSFIIQQF